MKIKLLVIGLLLYSVTVAAQNIYKTPSGKKYHLSSCRMVENVSKKLVDGAAVARYRLTPCKICKPPAQRALFFGSSAENKAVGQAASVQCKGITQRGTRCKHKTRLANGYCYQHTSQNSAARSTRTYQSSAPVTTTCGAKNKSGGYCKRKVKGGGRCYQHQ
jgi:hypothetical protein